MLHQVKQKSTPEFQLGAFQNLIPCNIMPCMGRDSHKYLRVWRNFRGLTQDQVVDRLAIHEDDKLPQSKAQLSKVENGKSPYSQRLLEALADIYDCDVWELVGKDPTKEGLVLDLVRPLTEAQRARLAAFIEGMTA